MNRFKSTKLNLYLTVLVILMAFSNLSFAEQFNGGNGLHYATSASPINWGEWRFTGHSRTYYWSDDYSNYLISMATSLNYGISPKMEGEITAIIYQDTFLPDAKGNANTPDDIYFRFKYGNIRFESIPVILGFQGCLRFQSGEFSNTPMEPVYDSGGHTLSFNLLASYIRNISRPSNDLQFHFNLGFTHYNDGVQLSDSRISLNPIFGVEIPLEMMSPSMEKLRLGFEFNSNFYIKEPDLERINVNSAEDYGYITGSLNWQMSSRFAYRLALDIKVFQEDDLTTTTKQFQKFPFWRINNGLVYLIRPGAGQYYPSGGAGGFGTFGAPGGGGGVPMGGMYGAANRAALYNWGGAVEGDIQYLEIELDKIREDRKSAEEALQKLKEKIEKKRQTNQSKNQSGN